MKQHIPGVSTAQRLAKNSTSRAVEKISNTSEALSMLSNRAG